MEKTIFIIHGFSSGTDSETAEWMVSAHPTMEKAKEYMNLAKEESDRIYASLAKFGKVKYIDRVNGPENKYDPNYYFYGGPINYKIDEIKYIE